MAWQSRDQLNRHIDFLIGRVEALARDKATLLARPTFWEAAKELARERNMALDLSDQYRQDALVAREAYHTASKARDNKDTEIQHLNTLLTNAQLAFAAEAEEHTTVAKELEDARRRIQELEAAPTPKTFEEIAREHLSTAHRHRQRLTAHNHGTYPVGTRVKGRTSGTRQFVVGQVTLQNDMDPRGSLRVRREDGCSLTFLDLYTVRRLFSRDGEEPPSDVPVVREVGGTDTVPRFLVRAQTGGWVWSRAVDDEGLDGAPWSEAVPFSCTPDLIEHLQDD